MIAYSPLINPPVNVSEYVAAANTTYGPINSGYKLLVSDLPVRLIFGHASSIDSIPYFEWPSDVSEIFRIGSAAPLMRVYPYVATTTVSLYDIGTIWNCDPPRAPKQVVEVPVFAGVYDTNVNTATEILFSAGLTKCYVAFAATPEELTGAKLWPVKGGFMTRWRLDRASRFMKFTSGDPAYIASETALNIVEV